MSNTTHASFSSKIRLRLFPVHPSEYSKFFTMNFMHIFVIFNFWLVHNMKDTLIVASAHSGAESISFIKMWAVFPASILFVMAYTWLSNHVSQRTLFYGILTTFMVFFAFFAFVLYPNRAFLHIDPDTLAQLKLTYPHLRWFFPMVGYWTYTIFYVFSELWAAIVLTLLFWQFANQITPVHQAKRFYMMFGTFSAFGMLAAGGVTKALNTYVTDWDTVFKSTVGIVVVNCAIIMLIYKWINKHVVKDSQRYQLLDEEDQEPGTEKIEKKKALKLTLWGSLKHIMKSDYLIYIAILAIGYNVSINFVEITWKSQLRELYPTKQTYNGFMGDFNLWLALSMFITGLIGVNVVRKFSWKTSAMLTPIVLFITGVIFFCLLFFGEGIFASIGIGVSAVIVAGWVGLFQNLAARSVKQSFFNTTREMAYIPLDAELKVKGKAAIDVLSGRVGKLGGAAVQQSLLIAIPFSTQFTIAPYLSVMLLFVVIAWIWAVKKLNIRFLKITRETPPPSS